MLEYVLTLIIGVIGGVSVGVQGLIAGAMSQRIGVISSSFIIHLGGMILSGLLLVWVGGEKIRNWHSLPWYMLGAGVFGVILYLTISLTLPRLGGTMMITLIIFGQLLAGILIDHYGWLGVAVRPIDVARIAGVVLILAGGYLIAR